jgi:serine phosphatase RsbU (regulator of sigma subunit)
MQTSFESILNNIANSSLQEDSRNELVKTIKDLQKQVLRLEFKYQSTLKEKLAISVLLEQSITELEEKRTALESQNLALHEANNRLVIAEEEIRQNSEELRTVNETLEERISERTHELAEQKAIIEEKNKDITHSMTYAQNIQNAIFPKIKEIKDHVKDVFVFHNPLDIVSGDFYWFSVVDDKIILAVIDCTGHGVPGAFMSIMGNEYLNQIVSEKKITEPDKILNLLHKKIRSTLKQADGLSRDGMDMALVCIDKEQNKIEFAGAKNPIYYIQEGNLTEIRGDIRPIGGEQSEKERIFTKHEIPLLKDSDTIFYLFSDGFQDQFGGPKNKKFLVSRFRELLFSIHDNTMSRQKELLVEAFHQWKGANPQTDDVSIIGIRI